MNRSPGPARSPVHIQIKRLTLPGYTAPQRRRFVQTLNRELTRLAGARDWSSLSPAHLAGLELSPARHNSTPEEIALQLALRLVDSLAPVRPEGRDG
jgi:hypothetical protein